MGSYNTTYVTLPPCPCISPSSKTLPPLKAPERRSIRQRFIFPVTPTILILTNLDTHPAPQIIRYWKYLDFLCALWLKRQIRSGHEKSIHKDLSRVYSPSVPVPSLQVSQGLVFFRPGACSKGKSRRGSVGHEPAVLQQECLASLY